MKRHFKRTTLSTSVVAGLVALTACGGAGGGGTDGGDTGEDSTGGESINVMMINPAQMEDLQRLTAEHFTPDTGIEVNFTALPENEFRDKMNQEFSSQAGQYDVASVSAFEVPIYAKNGWLAPLDDYLADTPDFDQDDIFPALTEALTGEDGKLYAVPFFGEGSFLMYRKDIFDAMGLTMPEQPTWHEVAELAAQVDEAEPGMAGICLRGQAGWGQNLASLTTVVNTFGGTWFDEDWNAQLTSPEFKEATQFYVDLLQQHGQPGAAQSGVLECLNTTIQGQAAMMYDATSLASRMEADDSPVKGKMGYVAAPVEETDSSSWVWTWAWGIQQASQNKDAAWEWISWASSKEYEQLVGEEIGWATVPAGKRISTYDIPEYQDATAAFSEQERQSILNADAEDPGVQPRPYSGVQFVGIPEFPDLGTQVSQQIASAIAGQISVDEALAVSQELAQEVGDKYKD